MGKSKRNLDALPPGEPKTLHDDIADALAEYRLSEPTLRSLRQGINRVYRVNDSDGRKYLLRIQSGQLLSDREALAQLVWLRKLHFASGMVVPEPQVTRSGKLYLSINTSSGPMRMVLVSWVPGRTMHPTAFVRPRVLHAVGQATAMLHGHGSVDRRLHKGSRYLTAEHFFGASTCAGPPGRQIFNTSDYDVVRRAADRVRRVMKQLDKSPEHFGFIHGDLEPPNWVFHQDDPRPIDFDESGFGYYLFDLMQILWTHAMWPRYPEYRAALLGGYESIRPIADDVRKHLDLFQAVPFIWWFNKGLSIDPAEQAVFRQWHKPTIQRLKQLCGIKK